jgi:hypothetical protein
MGRLIGLLALLNVVVLAVGLSMEQVRGHPAVLVDFNADKVRLLGRAERPQAAPAAATAATAATDSEDAAAKVPEATAEANAGSPTPRPRCLSWSGLDESLLAEIEARLKSAGIAASRYDIRLQKRLGWWVYLPPFANAEAMQAAIDAARKKGVTDIAPLRSGEMMNALSLGAFPTLSAARAHSEKLRALGVHGLRMGPRPNSGSARLTIADKVPEAKLAGLSEGWDKERAPLLCTAN